MNKGFLRRFGRLVTAVSLTASLVVAEFTPVYAMQELVEEKSFYENVIEEDGQKLLVEGADEAVMPEEDSDKSLGEDIIEKQQAGGTSKDAPTQIELNTENKDVLTGDINERYYKFDLPQNGKIQFSFIHETILVGGNVWQLKLYNSDSYAGTALIETLEYQGHLADEGLKGLVGLPKGSYFIEIRTNENEAFGKEYNFKINYEASEFWEEEIDSATKLKSIPTDKWINGSSCDINDIDYFKFDLPENGKINISFKHERAYSSGYAWRVSLFNTDEFSNKNCIESSLFLDTATILDMPTVGLPAGSYYVGIYSEDESSIGVQYDFKVNYEKTPDWEEEIDSALKPKLINAGTWTSGIILNTEDEDFYKFVMPQNGYINISFKHDVVNWNGDLWELQLYNSDSFAENDKILRRDYIGSNAVVDESDTISLYKGTYFIKISSILDITSDAQYSFKVNPIEKDETYLTIVAGRKVPVKDNCFPSLSENVAKYVVSNKKLASVTKNMLNAKKAGDVKVTAQVKTDDGTYKDVAVCNVRILSKPKLIFSVPLTYAGQVINASEHFTTTDTKETAATLWESSNPKVVRVVDEKTGKLEAVGKGTAKITAYFGEKGVKGTLKVSASLSVKIPKFSKDEYSVKVGAKRKISMKNVTAASNPEWKIVDESIATVEPKIDSKGNVTGKADVRGVKQGDTTLIVTIDGQEYKCTIHVL